MPLQPALLPPGGRPPTCAAATRGETPACAAATRGETPALAAEPARKAPVVIDICSYAEQGDENPAPVAPAGDNHSDDYLHNIAGVLHSLGSSGANMVDASWTYPTCKAVPCRCCCIFARWCGAITSQGGTKLRAVATTWLTKVASGALSRALLLWWFASASSCKGTLWHASSPSCCTCIPTWTCVVKTSS